MSIPLDALKNIDLEKLYHFYLIYKERSIKKVSDQNNISVSILRHSLHTLEAKLGLKLYHHSKKTFIPTEESAKLFALCRNIIEALHNYQDEVGSTGKTQRQRDLVIITTTTLANYYLPLILKEFDKHHPDVRVEVLCGPEYLNSPRYAFDVIISPKINNVKFVTKKLGTFTYKFYGSAALKKELAHLQSVTELKNQNLLLFSGTHFLSENIIKKNKIKAISNSYPFLLNLCRQGEGLLSCFNANVLKALGLEVDIHEIFSDFATEVEDSYFYHHRITDKADLIETLHSVTRDCFTALGVQRT